MTVMTSSSTPSPVSSREVWGAFIGGEFVELSEAETFEVMGAATGRTLARVVAGGAELVDRAAAG